MYNGTHHQPDPPRGVAAIRRARLHKRIAYGVAALALVVSGAGVAWAAVAANSIECDATSSTISPDGTAVIPLNCRVGAFVPQPDPSGSVTPSPSVSVSPSASASPTPSPTGTVTPSPSPSATVSPSPSPTTASPSPSPSVTPSPTATSTPTPSGTNCLARLAECGYPHAGNTGPTGTLQVVNQSVTITVSGVYADREIRGCLEVRAPNVTVRNVKVVGTCITGNVRTYAAGSQFLDMEVDCRDGSNSHGFNNGSGGNATIRRADIHDCENGLNVPGNTDIADSWIHNLYDGGDAHTDGAQFNQGASNIRFVHNTIDARGNTTSAIIMWDEGNPQNSNVLIDGNLMAGGAYTLYCARQGPVNNVVITNNRFGPYTFGHSNTCNGNRVTAWSNNVEDATGASFAH